MAEAIAAGVQTVTGAEARLMLADTATEDEIVACDALIIGSPVHMSCLDWRVKKFIDQVCGPLWMMDRMVGKVGAAFASGGSYGNAGGSCEGTLLAMLTNLAEMGMILVVHPHNDGAGCLRRLVLEELPHLPVLLEGKWYVRSYRLTSRERIDLVQNESVVLSVPISIALYDRA